MAPLDASSPEGLEGLYHQPVATTNLDTSGNGNGNGNGNSTSRQETPFTYPTPDSSFKSQRPSRRNSRHSPSEKPGNGFPCILHQSPISRVMARGHASKSPASTPFSSDIESPSRRVRTGRVTKVKAPAVRPGRNKHVKMEEEEEAEDEQNKLEDDDLLRELQQTEKELEAQRCTDMAKEKLLFPGSEDWAEEEDGLFETLFMRQYKPLLPAHWTMDFRGIPTPDYFFCKPGSDSVSVINSLSGEDVAAARALVNLFKLTGNVRTLVQSGVKHKASDAIHVELLRYLYWAAKDGGFSNLKMLPTLVLEVINPHFSPDEVTDYMQDRLLQLAESHRQFLRVDDDEREEGTPVPSIEGNDGNDGNDGLRRPSARPLYSRRPPVIYGIFIINAIVLVLTTDSAKIENATVSYHVEVDFNASMQGVWNAITVAIPICMARDDMATRKGDFALLSLEPESDPDV